MIKLLMTMVNNHGHLYFFKKKCCIFAYYGIYKSRYKQTDKGIGMKKILTIVSIVGFMEHCECMRGGLASLDIQLKKSDQTAQSLEEGIIAEVEYSVCPDTIWPLYHLLKEENVPAPLRSKVLSILRSIRRKSEKYKYYNVDDCVACAALVLHGLVCGNCNYHCDCLIDTFLEDSNIPIITQMRTKLSEQQSQPFFQNFSSDEVDFLIDFFCPLQSFGDRGVVGTMEHVVKYLLENEGAPGPDFIKRIVVECCRYVPHSKSRFLELMEKYSSYGNLQAIKLYRALRSDWREEVHDRFASFQSQLILKRLNNFQRKLDAIVLEDSKINCFHFLSLAINLRNRANFVALIEEGEKNNLSLGAMKQNKRREYIEFALRIVLKVPSPENVAFLKRMIIHMPADMYFQVTRALKILEGDGNIEAIKLLYSHTHDGEEMPEEEVRKLDGITGAVVPFNSSSLDREYYFGLCDLMLKTQIGWLQTLSTPEEREEIIRYLLEMPMAARNLTGNFVYLLQELIDARGLSEALTALGETDSLSKVLVGFEESDCLLAALRDFGIDELLNTLRGLGDFREDSLIWEKDRIRLCIERIDGLSEEDKGRLFIKVIDILPERSKLEWFMKKINFLPGECYRPPIRDPWRLSLSGVRDTGLWDRKLLRLNEETNFYVPETAIFLSRLLVSPFTRSGLLGIYDGERMEGGILSSWYAWISGGLCSETPKFGWRILISAVPDSALRVAQAVIPVLGRLGVDYKIVDSLPRMRYLYNSSRVGAEEDIALSHLWGPGFIVVYPENDLQANFIVNLVNDRFVGSELTGPRHFVPYLNSIQAGDTGGIYLHWCRDGVPRDRRTVPLIDVSTDGHPSLEVWEHPFDVKLSYLGKKLGRKVSEWGFHRRSTFERMKLLAPPDSDS
ncbi:MAG: hypothetical protein LBJ96_05470 [Holosporaceae bacterium]|nr:hypothetical protein [Holosporaceae bacterium]